MSEMLLDYPVKGAWNRFDHNDLQWACEGPTLRGSAKQYLMVGCSQVPTDVLFGYSMPVLDFQQISPCASEFRPQQSRRLARNTLVGATKQKKDETRMMVLSSVTTETLLGDKTITPSNNDFKWPRGCC